MKKIFILISIFFCIVYNLYGRNIVDIEKRTVSIPNKINRVIAIGPGALRFICYIGEFEKIVGIENIEFKLSKSILRPYWFAIKNRVKNLPVVSEGGPGKLPYFEKIISLKPQVIIAVGFTQRQADLIFEKTGIPVVLLSYGKLGVFNGKFEKSIKILGEIFHKSERAKEFLKYISNLKTDLKKRVINSRSKAKIYIGGIAYKGLHDITSTDTEFYPLNLLGIPNIASQFKLKGHVFISWENLVVWNPDLIFLDKTSLPIIIDDYKKQKGKYNILKAFKEKKVFIIPPYNYYNTNVETVFFLGYCIGRLIFPKRFKDIQLNKKAEEIYNNFLKIKIPKKEIMCENFFKVIKE